MPQENCGVVGVYAPGEDVARIAFFGLFALQHRGQESAGISVSDGETLRLNTAMGLVAQAFREQDLERLVGHIAIGHTRYSTAGSSVLSNAQPFLVQGPYGEMALGHNGNVVNALSLRQELEEWGCQFSTSTDSEVIAQLLANAPGRDWGERVQYLMRRVQGAYSLVVLTKDSLIAIRDPLGVRPLCVGKMNGGWIVASESCALDHLGAELLREIEPGEAIIIDDQGLRVLYRGSERKRASCIFEYIYFARPDSIIGGKLTYSLRQAMGAQLAREHPVDADVVIGVPDSATAAAVGYAQEAGIPYSEGLLKNRYVGRTFIEPDQRVRDLGVKLKFNTLPAILSGKRVIVVDDSIVRGTTTPHVVHLVQKAGATEVHLRVCAPPIRHPCHLGVDMASYGELIAAAKNVEEIRQFVGSDSLGYLSVEGLIKAVGGDQDTHCLGCFTGNHPIPVQLEMNKLALEISSS
ncbi:amidophosphoribosyltransferase [SAR202 cluster bacterium AC-647-N09_OGT_505m]|nr:amidophosphoribosyltransferase [SAR202 cluster bacterium AC-647-N09_OGT_505m]